MAWTTPRTWTTGEVVTAAIMNTHVRDNVDFLGSQNKHSATVSGGPTSGTTELTLATLNVPDPGVPWTLDVAAFWSGINNTSGDMFTFRIRVAGTTRASGAIRHSGGANQRMLYSLPTISPAETSGAQTVTVTIQRSLGEGTIDTASAGRVTATVMPRVT